MLYSTNLNSKINMRPTKNRVYCYGSQRSKMLFESKAKADNFIAYNSEGILEENGKAPVRSYYCELCRGYHVTSNPSIVAGESLDQRDQKMMELIDNYKKGSEDFKQIHEKISDEIDRAKRQMYLGNFEDIEQLYEEFQIDQDFLLKLPLKTRGKYVQLHQRVEILKEVAKQMKELSLLSKEEITDKLVFEDPSKKEKELRTIMRGYLVIQNCNKGIESIHQLMEEEKWIEARDMITSLRAEMPEMKGAAIVKECLVSYQQELIKLEKAIADKNKVAKKKEPVPNKAKSEKRPQEGEEYKAAILSVIERIEKVNLAFGLNDIDTCENELEIAEFLMDDFTIEDDNTKLLRGQIEMWKRKIAEGNE